MTVHIDHEPAAAAVLDALDALLLLTEGVQDADLLANSRCRGWSTGDVLVHVHLGLQEMLLGLVSPTDAPADTDATSYWRAPLPTNDPQADAVAGVRFVRLIASAYRRPTGLIGHLRPTVAGVASAVSQLPAGKLSFQGRVLHTGDFLATWACELAVHHLDLTLELTVPPAPRALAIARATVEALAGGALPGAFDDRLVVLAGAGRVPLSPAHRRLSGPVADRLPVLG